MDSKAKSTLPPRRKLPNASTHRNWPPEHRRVAIKLINETITLHDELDQRTEALKERNDTIADVHKNLNTLKGPTKELADKAVVMTKLLEERDQIISSLKQALELEEEKNKLQGNLTTLKAGFLNEARMHEEKAETLQKGLRKLSLVPDEKGLRKDSCVSASTSV